MTQTNPTAQAVRDMLANLPRPAVPPHDLDASFLRDALADENVAFRSGYEAAPSRPWRHIAASYRVDADELAVLGPAAAHDLILRKQTAALGRHASPVDSDRPGTARIVDLLEEAAREAVGPGGDPSAVRLVALKGAWMKQTVVPDPAGALVFTDLTFAFVPVAETADEPVLAGL